MKMTDVIGAGMPKCSLAITYGQPATVHVVAVPLKPHKHLEGIIEYRCPSFSKTDKRNSKLSKQLTMNNSNCNRIFHTSYP